MQFPLDIDDFFVINETMCDEVNNCFAVKILSDGRKICRGCGSVLSGKYEPIKHIEWEEE